MTLHHVAEVAKDGNSAPIAGGIRQHDTSGTGAGPNVPEAVLVDSTGAEVLGTTADAAVVTDTSGSAIGFLRGLVKLIAAAVAGAAGALFTKLTDGTNNLSLLAANSGAPAASVVAIPVSVRDTNPNGLAVPGSSAPVVIAPQTTDVSVTPTVTASAYVAGNAIGGVMTFASILPSVGVNGILQSITAKFKATAATGNLEVAIFKASPTGTYTDHAAPTWNSADMANLLGIYTMSTVNSKLGTMAIYNLDNIGKAFVGSGTSLFAVVIVDGTPTPASTSDFTLELAVLPG